jgi:hypothetical protein
MSFQPVHMIKQALLSGVQRHRLATSLIATGVLVAGLATPLLVQAQCVQTGNDWTCSGDMGFTTINAGSETNIFSFVEGVFGYLRLNGGGGSDTIDFSSFTTNLGINISQDYASNSYSVAQFVGPNMLAISWNGFTTGATVNTGSGKDYVFAGNGTNTISTGAGNDTIYSQEGNDTINGGDGDDTIYAGEGTNGIFGDAGSDKITSGSGNDAISGGEGDDTINAGEGSDYVTGGLGDDTLNGEAGDDVISSGEGVDTINGGDGTDARNDEGLACEGDTVTNVETDSCSKKEEPKPDPVVEVKAPAPAPAKPEMCTTTGSRVSVNDRGMIAIFSDFGPHNPNGMLITEIPLGAVRNPTDDEKASNAWVPLAYKESEYAKGWSVGLYWHDNHYGVIVYKDGGQTIVDDTGAICGWF